MATQGAETPHNLWTFINLAPEKLNSDCKIGTIMSPVKKFKVQWIVTLTVNDEWLELPMDVHQLRLSKEKTHMMLGATISTIRCKPK